MRAAPRIALVVDNPLRDLDGLVLVAMALCDSGCDVVLVPFNLLGREIWHLAVDFVLLNYLRKNNEAFVHDLLYAGIGVGVLDTEAGVFSDKFAELAEQLGAAPRTTSPTPIYAQYGLTMARDPAVRSKVSCFCAWTEEFASYAQKVAWYDVEQMFVTGPPRMDFYTEPLRSSALPRLADPIAADERPVVLVNGSYPFANPGFATREQERDMFIKHFGYDESFVDEWLKSSTNAMMQFTALVNRLAAALPGIKFVYRPHPFERLETYQSLLEKLPNIQLVQGGTVGGWLTRSHAVLHIGSTTSIEAAALDVPVFWPAWIPHFITIPATELVSRMVADEPALTQFLRDAAHGSYVLAKDAAERARQGVRLAFGPLDGKAYRRVADAITTSLGRRASVRRDNVCQWLAYHYGVFTDRLAAVIGRWMATRLGLSVHWSWLRMRNVFFAELPWDTSAKKFDCADAQRIVSVVAESQGSGHGKVEVVPADTAGIYKYGYREGRSVLIRRPAAA